MVYYMGIYYPEHEKEYIEATMDINICNMYGVINGYAISPLHSADGDMSKPHYHIILQSLKPLQDYKINEMKDWLVMVQRVNCLPQAFKYLTHDGFPEKEQFPADVKPILYGKFDMAFDDTENILEEILLYTDKTDNILDLTYSLINDGKTQHLKYLASHTYFFNSIFKEKNFKKSLDFE